MTTAETVAELFGNDGAKFETHDGKWIVNEMIEHGAHVEYAKTKWDDEIEAYIIVPTGEEHTTDTIERYEFPDSSAIVIKGDGWDIEGEKPFTWIGE